MIDKFKRLFYKDSIEECFICTLMAHLKQRWFTKSTSAEIEYRKNLSIFKYKELAQPLNYYPYHFIEENNFYGNGNWIFSKLEYNFIQKLWTRIEHSTPYIIDQVQESKTKDFCKNFITLSDERREIVKSKSNKNVLAVGPYIIHADNLLNKIEHESLKAELGKTLLVFPAHSIENIHSAFDSDDFVQYISSYNNKGFDTIMICMYWKDIQLGRALHYESRGCKVVTAGHVYDYNFLSRLKAIISLADFTISNSVGTHVGYCIALGKPHFVYNSNVKFLDTNNLNSNTSEPQENTKKSLIGWERMKDEVHTAFSREDPEITEEQIKCVKKYWGEF